MCDRIINPCPASRLQKGCCCSIRRIALKNRDQFSPESKVPNFVAVDATTGMVAWQDTFAAESIIVSGSPCSSSGASPAVATIGGVKQAIFAGRDGWVYGFDFADLKRGQTTLLWQFDCNPKTSIYTRSGKSRRNTLMSTPVIADDHVFIATGRNPQDGEGPADLWCIDPTKRGDISAELVFNKSFEDGATPIPRKPNPACDTTTGDFVHPNPNSGAVWHYESFDRNGNQRIEFDETFHRTIATPAIHDGLLFVADISGLLHCIDSKTGGSSMGLRSAIRSVGFLSDCRRPCPGRRRKTASLRFSKPPVPANRSTTATRRPFRVPFMGRRLSQQECYLFPLKSRCSRFKAARLRNLLEVSNLRMTEPRI